MIKYQYCPLGGNQEIRLVLLLPGKFEDPIRISIFHVRFIPPFDARPRQSGPNELQINVPHPWSTEETWDGDTLFLNKYTNETSWTHPSGNLPLPATQKPDFHPHYEALSYTWGTTENPEIAYVMEPGLQGNESCVALEIYQNLASAIRHLRYIDQVRVLWIDSICINQEDIPERNEQVKRMANIYKSSCGLAGRRGTRQQACSCNSSIRWQPVGNDENGQANSRTWGRGT